MAKGSPSSKDDEVERLVLWWSIFILSATDVCLLAFLRHHKDCRIHDVLTVRERNNKTSSWLWSLEKIAIFDPIPSEYSFLSSYSSTVHQLTCRFWSSHLFIGHTSRKPTFYCLLLPQRLLRLHLRVCHSIQLIYLTMLRFNIIAQPLARHVIFVAKRSSFQNQDCHTSPRHPKGNHKMYA